MDQTLLTPRPRHTLANQVIESRRSEPGQSGMAPRMAAVTLAAYVRARLDRVVHGVDVAVEDGRVLRVGGQRAAQVDA